MLELAPCAKAQVKVGDDLSMNLNGRIAAGYTADYGNTISSDHGLTLGGDGDLSGSYYNPNFLSFHILPYYNQSRANSTFQSISDTSGVTATAAIFSGSHFPGSVSYSKSYNGESNYAVPGLSNFTSHGNSGVFSLGWGVNIPDRPTLSFNFQRGSNDYSIYGANGESNSHFDSLSLLSTYRFAGFDFGGNYHHTVTDELIPEFTANEPALKSNASSDSFGFNAGHRLPFNGAFSSGVSRAYSNSEFTGGNYDATIDTLSAGVSFHPIAVLTFGSNAQYNDNLGGILYNSIFSAGGVIPESQFQQASHALDVNNYVNYQLPSLHLTLMGTVDHREQSIFGSTLTDNAYTGTVSYANMLLGGFLSAVVGVTENMLDVRDQRMLGLLSNVNYSRRFRGWTLSGGFNYGQNQQTLLITYTTSSYGYSGSVGRRLGRTSHWGASATGTKSVLNSQAGSGTFSQSYSTALSLKWLGVSGAYAKSSGNAILTGGGLAPTPIPLPVVTPTSIVLYGGRSYSFGVGASPFHRLTISTSYARVFNDTMSNALTSSNRSEMLTARVQYEFRQMSFQAGYTKLLQGFNLASAPPSMVGSYYVGVYRWFNFF